MKKLLCFRTLAILMIMLSIIGCKTEKKKDTTTEDQSTENSKNDTISIITRGMEFQSVDTIPSGWNTFKYQNLSNETHFFLLDKYPEGKTVENALTDVVPVFEEGMDLINEGKAEAGFAAFSKLPKWYSEIVFSGGSGLIAPKHTAITTVKLAPGYYMMECYVKMPNGKFHSAMGMAKPLIVTEEDNGNSPPEATINITLSGEEGITYDTSITKGEQLFSVFVKDQKPHENFIWHDVNLVKLDKNASEDALEAWMDWSDPKGLITPVPNGVTFLGGVNDMAAGSTGYFMADLKPGNYALISEVPNTKSKNLFKVFEVLD
ncbi:hypothetical protein ESY86_15575 [Subsaximicrobium wynnwilliamsii]|uniref:DUF4198 domain-containing protein n=1 Tax=Subsaximicrobium wynnwilliamsii TaxID=291179 RepID=A0A5C6ZDS7_9FLAO|nr:hypothetical protein [Subsaximicrobium wynnwilliamsii]TXD82087.1 hypothetical protein ESY87_15165 [Subsaximicrobium wynnwilliamsii]TXD87732.1 hypothetical protein ESY86_15575 [Subsaximicrobium wynnwilliamsii]TXE01543.1 hypothetical protein ESY88_15155 [Subsaximicrobium wynnwilliamsii]